MNDKPLTLMEHLTELRRRLVRSLIALAVGMGVSVTYAKEIFSWLQRPLSEILPPGTSFIATSPLEAMMTYLKVALLAGLFISSPVLFYQIWKFVVPGLRPDEKRGATLFVLLSTCFFVGGALFGYFVIFPIGFKFFVSILAGTEIRLMPQVKEYLAFITKMLLTFGLIFEMPLVLALLGRLGIIHHRHLIRAWRYVIVAAFLIAGVLTPGPDILSQLLLAFPLLGLYGISVLAVWATGRRSPGIPQTPSADDPKSPPE